MPILTQINIRDPFVVPDVGAKRYYMYGTQGAHAWGNGLGFDAFVSEDLTDWKGPIEVFRPEPGFWADRHFWAPEVYAYQGRFIMFASFKADGVCRGTQALAADTLAGPFVPHSAGPLTPADWECLDGHLFLDDSRRPWMIFCHEWVQVCDGTICAVRLNDDLSAAVGKPMVLFAGSAASWAAPMPALGRQDNRVTDGPFVWRSTLGGLIMLWSTIGHQGYAIGMARSRSGRIEGPWEQSPQPLFARDGGHGMIFTTFDGRTLLAIHRPNETPNERPVFLGVSERDGWLEVT